MLSFPANYMTKTSKIIYVPIHVINVFKLSKITETTYNTSLLTFSNLYLTFSIIRAPFYLWYKVLNNINICVLFKAFCWSQIRAKICLDIVDRLKSTKPENLAILMFLTLTSCQSVWFMYISGILRG